MRLICTVVKILHLFIQSHQFYPVLLKVFFLYSLFLQSFFFKYFCWFHFLKFLLKISLENENQNKGENFFARNKWSNRFQPAIGIFFFRNIFIFHFLNIWTERLNTRILKIYKPYFKFKNQIFLYYCKFFNQNWS